MSKKSKRRAQMRASEKNPSPAAAKGKTVTSNLQRCKTESILCNLFCLLLFFAFGYLAIMSFFNTSVIDPEHYSSEIILYNSDNLVLNIACTAIFALIVFRMRRHYDFLSRINLQVMEIVLAAYVAIIGILWISSVTSVPAADSYNIFEAATGAAKGDYHVFRNNSGFYNQDFYSGYSYFQFYPFQLGFVMICEVIYRIFGTSGSMPVQFINVFSVASAYFALARITRLVFKRRSVEFTAILLLAGCLQPVLLCTFVYGNVMGMSAAIWASLLLIKYFQTEKYYWLIPCGVILVLATLAKYNNMIYLAAFVIMLLIHTVKKKKWQSIAFAVALCIATVGTSNLVILSYEKRANVDLADGVSQVLYMDMGLQDSYMAPGWYTRTGLETYLNNGLDSKKAESAAWSDIGKRLKEIGKTPETFLDFYSKKITSQWNEPTFESIWVSKVKTHASDLGFLGKAVYDGSMGQLFELHFNLFIQILYILFPAGMFFLFLRKRADIETMLLPLVVLGGFSYHLLGEGKSQYVGTYIPLMIPVAAFALIFILESDYSKLKNLVKKINKRKA